MLLLFGSRSRVEAQLTLLTIRILGGLNTTRSDRRTRLLSMTLSTLLRLVYVAGTYRTKLISKHKSNSRLRSDGWWAVRLSYPTLTPQTTIYSTNH